MILWITDNYFSKSKHVLNTNQTYSTLGMYGCVRVCAYFIILIFKEYSDIDIHKVIPNLNNNIICNIWIIFIIIVKV